MTYYEERLRNGVYCAWMVIGSILMAGVLILIASCLPARAEEIDFKKIALIESSGQPLAHNKRDDSRGLYQITPICLKEYNAFHKDGEITSSSLWLPAVNEKVARWYLNVRIPQMLANYRIKDTVENRLIAYNAGISYLVHKKPIPQTTKLYLKKYRREK